MMRGLVLSSIVAATLVGGCSKHAQPDPVDERATRLAALLREAPSSQRGFDMYRLCCPWKRAGTVMPTTYPPACRQVEAALRGTSGELVAGIVTTGTLPSGCLDAIDPTALVAVLGRSWDDDGTSRPLPDGAAPSSSERMVRSGTLQNLAAYPSSPQLLRALVGEIRRTYAWEVTLWLPLSAAVLAERADSEIATYVVPLLADPSPEVRRRALVVLRSAGYLEIDGLDAAVARAAASDGRLVGDAQEFAQWMAEARREGPEVAAKKAVDAAGSDPRSIAALGRRRIWCRVPAVRLALQRWAGLPDTVEHDQPRRAARNALWDLDRYCPPAKS